MNPLMFGLDEPGSALVVAIDDGDGLQPIARRTAPAAIAIVGGVPG